MKALRRILLPLAALVAGVAPILRAASPDSPAHETERIRAFIADRILDDLDGRDWLVSGPLDALSPQLFKRAAARGVSLTLLDRALPLLPEETRAKVAALGEELGDAASVNQFFFARAWMESAPDEARAHLAMLDGQEIWRTASYDYLPSGVLYLGTLNAEESRKGLEERLAAAEAVWDEAGEFLLDSEATPASPEAADLRRRLRRGLSRSANELGVLLESAGMEDKAVEVYARAYRFDSANVSALMNRASLVKRGRSPGAQNEIVSELNRHNAASDEAQTRWLLAGFFGTVSHPEDFVTMGWPWALSGIPVHDGARLEEVVQTLPEELRPQVLRKLVEGWKLQTRATDRAKAVLGALREPESRAEMALALMRDLAGSDETGAIGDYWREVARKAGASEMNVTLSDVSIALGAREPEKAEGILRGALEKDSGNQQLWKTLVNLQGVRGDADGLRRSVAAIQLLKGQSSSLLPYAKGTLALAEGRVEEARGLLMEALETSPGDTAVLDPLLKIDMQTGGPAAAKGHAEAMLKAMPEHAFANYILGSDAYANGDYEAAVEYLGRSVATDAQGYTLNDYACALSELGRYEEAAKAIVSALQKFPDNPAMLDTYASILIGLEKWDEAEGIVAKAVTASASGGVLGYSGVLSLRTAQIKLHKGDREGAAAALRETEPFRKDFGPAERKILNELERALSEPQTPAQP